MKSGSQIEVMEPSLDEIRRHCACFAIGGRGSKGSVFSRCRAWLRKLACQTNAAPNAQQLESAGILQRDGDGRHYSTGLRLRRLAETLLLNNRSWRPPYGVATPR
jgi:hypothetical protein